MPNLQVQRGSIGVWLLPVMMALTIMLFGVLQHGHMQRQSWTRQVTLDHMAISAAILLAREMNILAMTNRALLANQLVVGQLVGIASWFEMLRTSTTRTATISAWIPGLNAVTRQIAVIVRQSQQPIEQLIRAGIVMQQAITLTLSALQTLVRSSFALMIPTTLSDIAKLHTSATFDFEILHSPSLLPFPIFWWSFVRPRHTGNDDRTLQALMEASKDPFSQQRTYPWFDFFALKIIKTGGTELAVDQRGRWHWQGLDTLSLHLRAFWSWQELPWGEGARQQQFIDHVTRDSFGQSRRFNPRAVAWALNTQRTLQTGYRIHYFDRPQLATETAPSVIVRSGSAVAKAGLRFHRPRSLFARKDQRLERANLFNPFWEGTLQSLSQFERQLLLRRDISLEKQT
ncbi:MAG TPA: hypothetical protein VFM61_05630 [Pseudidiomarina sp.]|nr:hypothetical protein [Pseudidiomarina sp.]